MNNDDVFAYVFEEDLIRSALPDWPQGMIAVLCLRADGDCKTVVGHIEEGHRVLRRVAQAMDMPERSFAVTPEVDGWPTRRVRFSEEQDMLKLIAGADQLSELAADYAINYRFAKDEGLNPDEVVSGRPQGGDTARALIEKVHLEARGRAHAADRGGLGEDHAALTVGLHEMHVRAHGDGAGRELVLALAFIEVLELDEDHGGILGRSREAEAERGKGLSLIHI